MGGSSGASRPVKGRGPFKDDRGIKKTGDGDRKARVRVARIVQDDGHWPVLATGAVTRPVMQNGARSGKGGIGLTGRPYATEGVVVS